MKLIFIFSVLFLSACSTLSKKECAGMDWQARGLEDGKVGESIARLDDYKQSCSKHGFEVSEASYKDAHAMGLAAFCTFDNGFKLGANGDKLFSECQDVNKDFVAGFQKGNEKWLAYLDSENARRRDFGSRRGPRGLGREPANH